MRTHSLITPPTAQPIHLGEAKAHLRVDGSADDPMIRVYIGAAENVVRNTTGVQMVVATRRVGVDAFPVAITLPYPPLVSVSSLTYLDTARSRQTLSAASYAVRTTPIFGYVEEAASTAWPSAYDETDSIQVTYICGHAAPFTVATGTEVFTVTSRTYTDADIVRVSNSGGNLPNELAIDTDYHVRDVSGSTFKLAATAGGAAIDITTAGTGTSFIGEIPWALRQSVLVMVHDMHEHRGVVSTDRLLENPTIESLLTSEKIWELV